MPHAEDSASAPHFARGAYLGASPLDDLNSLRIFVMVVETGSFSEVARRISVTPATISKHVAGLEGRLRQRLFNRTTRQLFVTDAGQRLYEHCLLALSELDAASNELADLQDRPAGHLRVTVPLLLGLHRIAPQLPRFMKAYPDISVDVSFTVQTEDLFQQRIDVAVRVTDTLDPAVVAIKLAPYHRLFCAAPAYLQQHGRPETPEDLLRHNCLIAHGSRRVTAWPTMHEGQPGQVHVRGTFGTNNGAALQHMAVAGMGVMLAPLWMVKDDLAAGRLVRILPAYTPPDRAVYAVMLQRTASSRKLAAFMDFLRECFADLG